jgi:putative flippase GtrA
MDWIIKFLQFGLVGLSGFVIDFALTWLCKEKLKWNKFVANSIGFTVAVVNNFYWNKKWTFASSDQTIWTSQFIKFVVFSLIGLLINNLLLHLFNDKLHVRFYVAKFFAIVCVFVWNFGTNYFFNFR